MGANDLELSAAVPGRPLLGQGLEAVVEAEEVLPILLGEAEVRDVLHESLVLPVPLRDLARGRGRVG